MINNNPGNIRSCTTPWQGQQGTDNEGFCIFINPLMGYRALWINLHNYFLAGLNTLRKIIYTWTPTNENDTDSALRFYCQKMNLDADAILIFKDIAVDFAVYMTNLEKGLYVNKLDIQSYFDVLNLPYD
jgi:hypothetical protein